MKEEKHVQVGSKEIIGDVWYFSANTYSNGGGYGLIYKNGEAYYEPQKYPKDEIVYIPEYGFPEREYDQVHEGDLISKYTRQDLIDITCSETLASELLLRNCLMNLHGSTLSLCGMNGAAILIKTAIGLSRSGHTKRYICRSLQLMLTGTGKSRYVVRNFGIMNGEIKSAGVTF